MSLLDEIARGGRTTAMDAVKAKTQGQRDYQELQMQSLKMEDWLEKREQTRRLKASLKGTDFTTPTGAAEASGIASDIGDPDMAINLAKLSDSLKAKDKTKYGMMKPIYSGEKHIGYAQKDSTGKLHNFKTIENITGKKKTPKASKVGKPSNEQIETATKLVKESKVLGESDFWGVGFDSDDYGKLGRSIASRSNKLQADAKDMGQGISDQEAMNIAAQEIENMGKNLYEETGYFGGKELVEKIEFEPGTSSKLMEFLNISTTASPTKYKEGDTWSDNTYDYRFVNGKTQRKLK